MAEDTNLKVQQVTPEMAKQNMETRAVSLFEIAATQAGMNPTDAKHKAAVQAAMGEYFGAMNSGTIEKLYEKEGFQYSQFMKEFNTQMTAKSDQVQTLGEKGDALSKEIEDISKQAEALESKKGTRRIINIVAGIAGVVGGWFGTGALVKNRMDDGWMKNGVKVAGAAVAGWLVNKITSMFTTRPLNNQLESLGQIDSQKRAELETVEKQFDTVDPRGLIAERDKFDLSFAKHLIAKKLHEAEKTVAHSQHPHPQHPHAQHTQHVTKPVVAANAKSDDTPNPEEQAKIEAERKEGKNFAQKEVEEVHPNAAGTQQLAGDKDVIEKKKEPWEAAASVAPKPEGFASKLAAPAENHVQAAIESKELANAQQLAVG